MRRFLLYIFSFSPCFINAQQVDEPVMQAVYDEVKTPFKYGMVVSPVDNGHKIDCPTVFQENGKWYMTFVVYNGKDGLDGRGYETWLAKSDDLLNWNVSGRILSYKDSGWDQNQRGGFPSLVDWTWGGSEQMQKYKGCHWMTYIGGHGTGYEAVREPLNIGKAWTNGDITTAHEWESMSSPMLSINDKDVQWWEKLVQYKSTIYWDKAKTLGKQFVMFYNAGGINPENNMKAERIGIALSEDMVHWKRYKNNPVYFHESPGVITGDAQIVKMNLSDVSGCLLSKDKEANPFYVMFYFSAYNPSRKYNAYNTFSVSRDLIHWQDWKGRDLIYPSKPYDDMFAHKSYVLKHDGVVYHFYCAVNKAGQRGIAVATSVPMGRSDVHFPEPDTKNRRNIIDLNKKWNVTFGKTTEDSITSKVGLFSVDVPNNLDDYYGYRQLKHGNLHGTAFYDKNFQISKHDGKSYFLRFEGVGSYATVILNGHKFDKELVGRTVYTLDVTRQLQEGNNQLRVIVDHPDYQTESPWVCGGCSSEWGFSEGSQPFGIFRPVTIVETDNVRIEPFGVHIWNNSACDSIFVDTEVKNYSSETVAFQLVSKMNQASGKTYFRLPFDVVLQPGEKKVIRQSTSIANPHLWNLDDPYLYNMVSMIKRNGNTTDEISTEYGIRSISWPVHRNSDSSSLKNNTADVFLLNNSPVYINGTCEYEHLFGQSHAFSHEQIASRVKMIGQCGFNAFREAHQPHNLYYQQLFDEKGILFWSQFSAHIWYDTPTFRDNFKKLLRQYIKERRNSPSIILWGLQNESVLPKDFAEECSDIIREMDPTSINQRAITTCNGGEGTDWNVVQNWSGTYGGDASNYDKELKRKDQLLNGEYGAWRTLGLHSDILGKDNTKKYSEEAFTELLKIKSLKAYSVKDSVCGQFQWCLVSHDNPGRVQPDEALRRIDKVGPFNYKGIFSPWEQPTEAFYMYRNLFADSTTNVSMPTAADRKKDLLKGVDGYNYVYRLNCGGDAYKDSYGQYWMQDDSTYSSSWSKTFGLNPYIASQGHILANIHGTEDDSLFQYFRWGRNKLKYHFKVPNGEYRLELFFAEPWLGARYGSAIDCEGERIFDVAVNDSTVIDDLDLWAEAGFAGAMKRTVNIKVTDGKIDISFPEVKVGEAVLSAIAIATKENDCKVDDKRVSNDSHFWRNLDNDTIAKYPKELLPKDDVVYPVANYKPVIVGKGDNMVVKYIIKPGLAREYALRFHFKNTTGKGITANLKIVDCKNIVVQSRSITFPTTPKKYKLINTTTGTQINAGTYKLLLSGVNGVDFEMLDVQ
nr:beta-galactosidase [Prevotella sp.]